MRAHRLSGSRYAHALMCAYAYRADAPPWPERPTSDAAGTGTAAHAMVEAHQLTRMSGELVEPKPSPWDVHAYPLARQANGYLDGCDVPSAVELAIVYDAERDTARRVDGGGHREYGDIGPMEVPMTLDLVWVRDDHVEVRDLKTGSASYADAEQLTIQGLAASRLFGVDEARVAFLYARKTKVDAKPLETLDADALQAEAWQVSALMRRLPVAQPEPGDWCWRCPLGRERCPAYTAPTAEEMAEADASVLNGE